MVVNMFNHDYLSILDKSLLKASFAFSESDFDISGEYFQMFFSISLCL
jgi:hypothetical protein